MKKRFRLCFDVELELYDFEQHIPLAEYYVRFPSATKDSGEEKIADYARQKRLFNAIVGNQEALNELFKNALLIECEMGLEEFGAAAKEKLNANESEADYLSEVLETLPAKDQIYYRENISDWDECLDTVLPTGGILNSFKTAVVDASVEEGDISP